MEYAIPRPLRLPVSPEEWQLRARACLAPGTYDYLAGAAGSEDAKIRDEEAFRQWRIVPRFLQDVAKRDLSVKVLGVTFPAPVLLAPIGRQALFHPEAEAASARAAASLGVPFILGTESSRSIEEVAAVMGDAVRWFQLYPPKSFEVAESFIRRAEASGYSAIVITVDRPLEGWQEPDLRNAYFPIMFPHAVTNFITDPVFMAGIPKRYYADHSYILNEVFRIFYNPAFTWRGLSRLRNITRLPILLKGILHPVDAEQALAAGADGIVVSNHSGRQLDGTISALEALPSVCERIRGRIPVLMDSGIRRGADVMKALALGASAVLVGRLYVYALSVAGEVGVTRVVSDLIAELDISMANAGICSVSGLNSSLLVRST
ncbi:lactate 2-monooxygenase [Gordoniibacillus kamchatkensis]|uniref:L-lactate oxidase n=2 Tax=Gordoniibacillus kamchatkensis TaxID=1590651 RepID=A0ABR5AJ20_9BACL|nr:lactate 2-monooxygenase [Paenibacillus sp. VKM B-2647]